MANKTPDGRARIEPTITLGTAKQSVANKPEKEQSPQERPDKGPANNVRSSNVRSNNIRSNNTPSNNTPSNNTPLNKVHSNQNQSGSRGQSGAQPVAQRSDVIKKGVNRRVFAAMVGLFLIAIVAGGWFFYQQLRLLQNDLMVSRDALVVSTSQLGNLESRLINTDQSIGQAGDQTSEKLKILDSEIRKLWVVSNERNKEAIGVNERGLAALKSSLEKVEKTAELSRKQLGAVQEANAAMLARNKEQGITITSLKDSIIELDAQLGMQDAKLISLQQRLDTAANQNSPSDTLLGKVESNVQAIESIDVYRGQTNSSLEQLNRDIRILYQRTMPNDTNTKSGL